MKRRRAVATLAALGAAGLAGPAAAQAPAAGPDCLALLRNYRDAFQLTGQKLEALLISGFALWDDKLGEWRQQPLGHVVVHSRLVVLHLWADYCAPCRVEFPWLRDLTREAVRRYRGQVQFLFVSQTNDSGVMQAFMKQNRAGMPEGPHYLDSGGGLARSLGLGLPSGTLPLPTTLLCDDQRVVRLALVGPLTGRRDDLRDAIERLLGVLTPAQAGSPL